MRGVDSPPWNLQRQQGLRAPDVSFHSVKRTAACSLQSCERAQL